MKPLALFLKVLETLQKQSAHHAERRRDRRERKGSRMGTEGRGEENSKAQLSILHDLRLMAQEDVSLRNGEGTHTGQLPSFLSS